MHYCGIIKPFDVSMIMVIVYGDWQEIQKFGMQLDKRSIPCRLRNGGQGWVACVNDRSSFHHEIELRRTASWRGCNYSVFLRCAPSLESHYFWSVNKNILHKCSIPCTTWIFHADQYSVRLGILLPWANSCVNRGQSVHVMCRETGCSSMQLHCRGYSLHYWMNTLL